MKCIRNYAIQNKSFENMCAAGRWNPFSKITFRDRTGSHTHKIGIGSSSKIDVYRESHETYLLSRHHRLDTVSLDVFAGSNKVGDPFLQGAGNSGPEWAFTGPIQHH